MTINQTTSLNPDGQGAQTLAYLGKGQKDLTQTGNVPSGGGSAPGLTNNTLGVSSQDPGGTTPNRIRYFTRDPSGTLLGERTSQGNYYYIEDANGSIINLTDNTGNPVNTYTYDPWGQTTTTGTAPNSFGYDSGLNMPGGLIHYGQRYYDPNAGSWTQQDPTPDASDPTQADGYTYSGCDPINHTDPTGEIRARARDARHAEHLCDQFRHTLPRHRWPGDFQWVFGKEASTSYKGGTSWELQYYNSDKGQFNVCHVIVRRGKAEAIHFRFNSGPNWPDLDPGISGA